MPKERLQKKALFVVFYYKGVRAPPPFLVPWESEIFLVNIFVVVDAIGLETDFTLETNRKRMKETLLKSTLRLRKQAIFFTPFLKAPEFHLSDHDFQTMQIQTF